jgi:hypothetical protein
MAKHARERKVTYQTRSETRRKKLRGLFEGVFPTRTAPDRFVENANVFISAQLKVPLGDSQEQSIPTIFDVPVEVPSVENAPIKGA